MATIYPPKFFRLTRRCFTKFGAAPLLFIATGFLCPASRAQDSTDVKEVSRDAPTGNSDVDASVHSDVLERRDHPEIIEDQVKQAKPPSTRWNYTSNEEHPTAKFWPARTPSIDDLAAPDRVNSKDTSNRAPTSFRAGGAPPEIPSLVPGGDNATAPSKPGVTSIKRDGTAHRSDGESAGVVVGLTSSSQHQIPEPSSASPQMKNGSTFGAASEHALEKDDFHFPESTTFNPGQNFPRPVTASRLEPKKHAHAHKSSDRIPSETTKGLSVSDAKRSGAKKAAIE